MEDNMQKKDKKKETAEELIESTKTEESTKATEATESKEAAEVTKTTKETEGAGVAETKELKQQLAEQVRRADEYYQRLVRMQADFENYRRRTGKEKEEFFKFAAEDLIVKLLPVLDNFERALTIKKENDQNLSNFKEGIELIYRQFSDILIKEGLTIIPTVGEQFDPVNHEVIFQEEAKEQPENTILEELRRGYCFKEKVIRPAWVKVTRSG